MILPILGQPVCDPSSNCVCDQDAREYLHRHNWFVVPWSNGGCYFHNFKTRVDLDNLPNHLDEAVKDIIWDKFRLRHNLKD